MKNLNFDLKTLGQRKRDGNFATQAHRAHLLPLIANQLVALGYVGMHAHCLRTKHLEALVQHWQPQAFGTSMIKNRKTALCWWAEKVGKQSVMKRCNADHGIDRRVFVSNVSKECSLYGAQLERVTDPYSRALLLLQAAFGLQREERIKIIPTRADGGSVLSLAVSWANGGKARVVPFITAEQRAALENAKQVAGRSSLIPRGLRYRDPLQKFRYQCSAAGISLVHGLRHCYAQQRYMALTAWGCPADGGAVRRQLTAEQNQADRRARTTISEEMGHYREQITAVCRGR